MRGLLRSFLAYAVLTGVCLLALTPMLWKGIPSGHDFEFHMYSWMEVVSQWKQGILYPRWAARAHWGYGEARFLFYPPTSWTLGASLGLLLPWKLVPGAYAFVVLALAGCSMYLLARRWLSDHDALFAAVVYAINPYHLIIVYWRSAMAELLAAALLPLLVMGVLRLREQGVRPMIALSLVLAMAWLTNAPAAVMIHYSVAALVLVVAIHDRSWRILPRAGASIVMGAALASFYLVPAVFEEKWVNISEVLAPGVRPQDNFLFSRIPDPEHNQFNLLVSVVASVEIACIFALAWFARRRSDLRLPWLLTTAWGALAGVLMAPFTKPLWLFMPELRFVQLPWRWLLCLNAALALLFAIAIRKRTWRCLVAAALGAMVILGGYRIQQPWWDSAADVAEMHDAFVDSTGYEGTDEYVPAGADPYELNKESPSVVGAKTTRVSRILQWQPLDRHVMVQAGQPDIITLRLFNYPAWEVVLNGKPVAAKTADVTGQMQIPIDRGESDIRIHFGRTADRTIGGQISLVAVLALVIGWTFTRKSRGRLSELNRA